VAASARATVTLATTRATASVFDGSGDGFKVQLTISARPVVLMGDDALVIGVYPEIPAHAVARASVGVSRAARTDG
jgi:hypothetical protein